MTDKVEGTGPALVIGLGNPLMGDDAIGLIALERLAALVFAPPVEFVDGGAWGLALLPDIERAGALLLLDAVHGERAPGALYVLGIDQVPHVLHGKLSPHQVDVRELLALAQWRGGLPSRLQIAGVQPAAVEYGSGLSPEAAAALDGLVEAACAVLAAWGHVCQPAATAGSQEAVQPGQRDQSDGRSR